MLFAALVALAVSLVAFFLALTISEPRSLGPISTRTAKWVDSRLSGIDIDYREVLIGWRPSDDLAELVFTDVRLARRDGSGSATVPRLVILCEVTPLFSGKLKPRSAIIEGGNITLEWSATTLLSALGGGEATAGSAFSLGTSDMIAELLTILAMPEGDANPLSRLATIEARAVDIDIIERDSSVLWRIPGASVVLGRRGGDLDIAGSGDLETKSGKPIATLGLTGRIDGTANRRSLEFELVNLDFGLLARDIAPFAPLAGMKMPVSASLFSEAESRTDRLLSLGLSLHGDAGSLMLAPWYSEARAFSSIDISLDAVPAEGRILIRRLGFESGEAIGFFSGEVVFGDADLPSIKLLGGIDRLTVADLVRLWPEELAHGARNWITRNIVAGTLPKTDLHLDIDGDMLASGSLPEEAFYLDFDYEGLEVHALRPMPPIRDVRGSARLDGRGLALGIEGGNVEGLPVTGSRVLISGFDSVGPETADIILKLRGPIPDVLRLIDHEPLGYTTGFGIMPDDVRGEAVLSAALGFPLVSDLALDQLSVAVTGPLSAVRLLSVAGGADLTDGDIAIKVGRDGLSADGTGNLAHLPIAFRWREDFTAPEGAFSTRIEVEADADRRAIAMLATDPGDYLEGIVPMTLLLEGRGPGDIARGHISADLGGSALKFDLLDWHKAASLPARLGFDIIFDDPRGISLTGIELRAGGDLIDADLLLHGPKGALSTAILKRVVLGSNDVSGDISIGSDGMSARLGARQLDARPFLSDLSLSPRGSGSTPPFDISIEIDRLLALEGVETGAVRLHGIQSDNILSLLDVDGSLDSGEPFAVRLSTPDAAHSDRRNLEISAGNAGRLLSGLGVFSNAENGDIRIMAELEGKDDDFSMSGAAHVENFRIIRSRTLERVLEKEEASRLDEIAGPGGIAFDRLEFPFSLHDGIIDVENALANGPRLGLTLEGQIDRSLERLNVNGIIVPAYGINSLLGKIPLLGTLFSGGRGGGMFALSYRVSGNVADPQVDINMLTALIPGILRKPFEGSKGKLDPRPEVAEEPAKEPPSD